jgi:hypothetical protein
MTFDCAHRPHGFRAAHACLTASDEQDELGREPEENPKASSVPSGQVVERLTGVNNAANSGFLLWLFVPCLGAVPLLVWAAGRPSREPPPSPCPGTRGDAPRCCLVLHLDLLGWHGHPSVSRRRACVVAWLHPFPGLLRGRRGRPLRSVRARPPDRAISRNWLDAARGGRHRRSLLASGGGGQTSVAAVPPCVPSSQEPAIGLDRRCSPVSTFTTRGGPHADPSCPANDVSDSRARGLSTVLFHGRRRL